MIHQINGREQMRDKHCTHCMGSGEIYGEGMTKPMIKCPKCGGSGRVTVKDGE